MFTHDIFQIQLWSKRSIVPIIVRITGIDLQKFPARLSCIILFVRSYGVFLIEFLRIWKTETNFFRKGMHFFFQYRAQRGESCNPHQFRVSIDFGRWKNEAIGKCRFSGASRRISKTLARRKWESCRAQLATVADASDPTSRAEYMILESWRNRVREEPSLFLLASKKN